jgi:hypothetical protein
MRFNRNISDSSPQEQRSRDKRLRSAWLAIPDPLRSRPEPRGAWDSAARADCPTSPWEKTIDPLRAALRAAIRTGDAQKVKAVTIRIELFMEAMKADVLAVNPLRDEANILRVAIEETEAQAGGDCAIQEVLADLLPDGRVAPHLLENAEQKLTVHMGALERCRALVSSMLRPARAEMRVAR